MNINFSYTTIKSLKSGTTCANVADCDFLANELKTYLKTFSKDKLKAEFTQDLKGFYVQPYSNSSWQAKVRVVFISKTGASIKTVEATVTPVSISACWWQAESALSPNGLYDASADITYNRGLGYNYYSYSPGYGNYQKFFDFVTTGFVVDPTVNFPEIITSWYKAHLLDKKQNEIIQGKFLEFTNKSNSTDIQKVAVVGGGILASGFKGATSTVDSFRVLTNAKLKPGTYKEALDAALGIKNSTSTYNVFGNVNGYKYVGMFKVTPDAVKVEELKQAGDTVTGTITSAGGYVLATGKELLMKALGFTFNTQAGLWMMRMSAFLTMSQSTGEIAVTGAEGQITYQKTSSTDVTGMNDPALEKQSDYYDAVSDYFKEKEQEKIDNNETPEDDATETEENPVNDVMENIKTLWTKISGLVENAYNKIDIKNDILNVEHTEATQLYDNSLSRPQAKQQAYELEYSKQVDENYTDTAGNTNSILKGSKANTKLKVRKDIEQHVKDYSDNESYAELNNFNPSEYQHEEQEIVPNATYEEKEYKIMALAMELVTGTITNEEYQTKLNELR